MYNRKNSFLKHFDFLLVDTITLIVSFLLGYLIRSNSPNFISSNSYTDILLWMLIPNIIYYFLFNPYKDVLRRGIVEEVKLSIIHTLINFLFIVAIIYVLKLGNQYSRLVLGYTYIIYFVLSIITRLIWKTLIHKNIVNSYKDNNDNLLIIGKSENIDSIIYNFEHAEFNKYNISAIYLIDDNYKKKNYKIIKNRNEIYNYVVDNNINTIFITTQLNKSDSKVIKKCIEEGIEVQLYIDSIFDVEAEDKEIGNVAIYNTLQLNSYTFTDSQRIYFVFKRLFDIIFSLIACIFLIPFYIFIKINYLLTGDNKPIVYTQRRVGLNGVEFDLYKFRSMVHNADDVLKELLRDKKIKRQWDKNQKIDNDPRITKVGRFIRKTSIDEFPQFINVLKGDMSIIGPRPLVPGELKSKNGIKLYERVKPGITGWWACNGRSDMSYEERLEHEYYYVKNCSLYLDLMTIFRTIYAILLEKGAK